MAVGWGIPPYGEGDWGGLNTVIAGTGTVSLAGAAPFVNPAIIPGGASVLVGSAPVVVVRGTVKTPNSAVLDLVGHAPSLNTKIFTVVGALNVVGVAPGVGIAIEPATGTLTAAGFSPKVDAGIVPGSGALVLVGTKPTVKNPNWVNIDDNQTPNWTSIPDSQNPNWLPVAA